MDETSLSEGKVYELLRGLKADGKLRCVYVWERGLDDHMHRRPMYQMVKAADAG
jgi:hypothetical protein